MKNGANSKSMFLLLLVVGLLGGGAIYWQYSGMTAAEARVMGLEAEVPDEKELSEMLASSQTELTDFQTKLMHLEKSIPPAAYVPTLIKELEAVGKLNKVSVTGIRPVMAVSNPNATAEKKPYDEIELDIVGRGGYMAVLNLVTALQSFPKILSVSTVAVIPKRDQDQKQTLEATVRIRAFVFANDAKKEAEKPTEKVASLSSARGGQL